MSKTVWEVPNVSSGAGKSSDRTLAVWDRLFPATHTASGGKGLIYTREGSKVSVMSTKLVEFSTIPVEFSTSFVENRFIRCALGNKKVNA